MVNKKTGAIAHMRTHRLKTEDWFTILIIGLFALALNACGSGGRTDSAADPAGGKGSLAIRVTWPDAPRSASSSPSSPRGANMNCGGISSVAIQIYGPPPAKALLASGGPWDCDLGNGQVRDIPATSGCTVVLIARNADGQIEYHGSQAGVNIIAGQMARADITAEHFVPDLISPADPTPQFSVTCAWSGVTGAQSYEMRLSTNADMSQYTASDIYAITATPGGLTAGITYYCQVAAKDQFGNIGCGSNILNFSVLMGSPTLISPANGAVVLPGDVSCSWQGPDDALGYHLTVATDSQLTTALADLDLPSIATSYVLSDLVVGQAYYWRVSALDAEGRSGPPSETFGFTPGEAVMQLTTPQNGAVLPKESVRLEWQIVPLAGTLYRVTLSTVSDPDHPVDSVTTAGTFFESSRLEDGVNYLWQVERLNSGGAATHISPRWKFGTMAKPALTAPGDNSSQISGNIDFGWQNVPNNGYQIIIATDPALNQVIDTQITDPSANTYHAGDLSPGLTYYWRVWPRDSANAVNDGFASEIRRVKTLGSPPVPIAPVNGATLVRRGFDFSWSAVTNAGGYALYVSENANPRQSPTIAISQSGTSYHLSDLSLANGTRYYWQVFANDSAGSQGAGSNIFSFQTVVSIQAEPVSGADPRNYIPFDNYYFFVARENLNSSITYLWRKDSINGPATRIQNLINVDGQPEMRDAQNIYSSKVIGQTLYFSSYTEGIGHEICKITDPAVAQIQVVDKIDTKSTNIPSSFMQCGSFIFYVIKEGETYTDYNEKLRYYNYASQTVGTVPTGFVMDGIDIQLSTANKLFFDASEKVSPTTAEYGMELWVVEVSGTSLQGTHMVKDIEPGEGSSYPMSLTAMDGFVLFTAADGIHGRELWRTDGTAENTVMLKDICPGSCSAMSGLSVIKDGRVYFWADDTDDLNYDEHLWRTDGTPGGTGPIESKTTHERITGYNRGMAVLGDELFFRARDSVYGDELRRSDGTFEGTRVILDIWPGPTGSELKDATVRELAFEFLFPFDGYIYFRATEPTYGSDAGEIWRTDGTPEGTEVIEAFPGPQSSFPIKVKNVGGILYFDAGDLNNGWDTWHYFP